MRTFNFDQPSVQCVATRLGEIETNLASVRQRLRIAIKTKDAGGIEIALHDLAALEGRINTQKRNVQGFADAMRTDSRRVYDHDAYQASSTKDRLDMAYADSDGNRGYMEAIWFGD
jgi:hypothetical protein